MNGLLRRNQLTYLLSLAINQYDRLMIEDSKHGRVQSTSLSVSERLSKPHHETTAINLASLSCTVVRGVAVISISGMHKGLQRHIAGIWDSTCPIFVTMSSARRRTENSAAVPNGRTRNRAAQARNCPSTNHKSSRSSSSSFLLS